MLDAFPIWTVFGLVVLVVVIAIEAGYLLGRAGRSGKEKESPVSAISGTTLGLLAFILAFTFSIVSERYDTRRALVRDEANALRTAYSRSEFLPTPDRDEAHALLKRYLDLRVNVVRTQAVGHLAAVIAESESIQQRLWHMAVLNARKDMNSDVAALYIEALNDVYNVHALRVAIGMQSRIPPVIWIVLIALIVLAMAGVGYQIAIAESRRTWASIILALSFSLVIALIAELDRGAGSHIQVTQRPLVDLQSWMSAQRPIP